jgi:hypothetical protein
MEKFAGIRKQRAANRISKAGGKGLVLPTRKSGEPPLTGRWVFNFDGIASQIPTIVGVDGPGRWSFKMIAPVGGSVSVEQYVLGGQNNTSSMQYNGTTESVAAQRWGENSGTYADIVLGNVTTLATEWDGGSADSATATWQVGDPVVASGTWAAGATGPGANTRRVAARGNQGAGFFFEGVVAEVRMWDNTTDFSDANATIYLKINEGPSTEPGSDGVTIINYGTSSGINPSFTLLPGVQGDAGWEFLAP